MVGDGSYLMLPGELATVAELGVKLIVVLVQNHGYASIGALSRSVGGREFGTHYGEGVDLATNAESLGLRVLRAETIAELREALGEARAAAGPIAVHVETDRYAGVPGYESWWDVPVAEVGGDEGVRAAREAYEAAVLQQRTHLEVP